MTRATARGAALQVGEFAAGSVAAYAVVGAAWALTNALWVPVLLAAALVVAAVTVEVRVGPKATGFVAGLLPTAVVTVGLLAALSMVLHHLRA